MRRLALLPLLALAACTAPAAEPSGPRPVLWTRATPTDVDPLSLAGTVQARVDTPFSFRVLGRLTSRPVNIGDLIAKDQTLATIDPIALQLAVRSAEADLASAQAQLTNALGVAERQSTLLKTNATTQAQLDVAEQGRSSALAGEARAKAALAKAKEELGYAVLKADFAGVVTATGAEVGQTVQPGQMVVDIADPTLRDAVVDAPDAAVGALKLGDGFEVAAQLDPSVRVHGEVREIAPQADALTRTRRLKIALDKPPSAFRLGSTITAYPSKGVRKAVLLPASAILRRDGKTFVWLVADGRVATHEVTLPPGPDNPVEVAGLEPGAVVVTAGVHSLTEGQQVRIDMQATP